MDFWKNLADTQHLDMPPPWFNTSYSCTCWFLCHEKDGDRQWESKVNGSIIVSNSLGCIHWFQMPGPHFLKLGCIHWFQMFGPHFLQLKFAKEMLPSVLFLPSVFLSHFPVLFLSLASSFLISLLNLGWPLSLLFNVRFAFSFPQGISQPIVPQNSKLFCLFLVHLISPCALHVPHHSILSEPPGEIPLPPRRVVWEPSSTWLGPVYWAELCAVGNHSSIFPQAAP